VKKNNSNTMKNIGVKIFAGTITVGVLVVAGIGAYLAGAPSTVRMQTFDSRRISDLQSLTYGIESYYRLEKSLPTDLQTLKATREVYVQTIQDPETGAPYEYVIKPPVPGVSKVPTYQLCATFALPSPKLDTSGMPKYTDPSYVYPAYEYGSTFWEHPAGRHCFALEVRPETK